jgi:hypothetical protein
MPALVHNSPALSALGLAVLSQDKSVAPNGLVTVSVKYSVTQARSASISDIFYLDAPPPVKLPIQDSIELHRSRLFLRDYQVTKQNGLWEVAANYVGAKLYTSRVGFDPARPLEVRESESRVTDPIRFFAGTTFDATDTPGREIPFYDYVTVQYVAQTVVREIASAQQPLVDNEFIISDASPLISRVSFGSISKSNPRNRVLFNYPNALFLLRRFDPKILVSTSITAITNRVFISVTTQEVILTNTDAVIYS